MHAGNLFITNLKDRLLSLFHKYEMSAFTVMYAFKAGGWGLNFDPILGYEGDTPLIALAFLIWTIMFV